MTEASPLDGPDFLIVGSARSGTTLAQRLACELPGVGMPPETHFFDLFVPQLLTRGPLPLDGPRLRDEIALWAGMDEVRGMDVDADAVVDDLGGRCTSLVDFFDVLVKRLVRPSGLYGEKTPKHLLWWRQLTRARPRMKIVAIVRDPRAVVGSNIVAPWAREISSFNWGDDLYVAMAERWRVEQQQILAMARALGPRCIVLRYEDVVADPRLARSVIADLLGADHRVGEHTGPSIVLPWETWKHGALADIDAGSTSPWVERLGHRRSRVVTAICGPVMRRFDYALPARDTLVGVAASSLLDPRTQRRRHAYRKLLASEMDWIDGVSL